MAIPPTGTGDLRERSRRRPFQAVIRPKPLCDRSGAEDSRDTNFAVCEGEAGLKGKMQRKEHQSTKQNRGDT